MLNVGNWYKTKLIDGPYTLNGMKCKIFAKLLLYKIENGKYYFISDEGFDYIHRKPNEVIEREIKTEEVTTIIKGMNEYTYKKYLSIKQELEKDER